MQISLDQQTVSQTCRDCGLHFTVVRGSIYDEGRPIGLYLIALHGHSLEGRRAHIAIATRSPNRDPSAMAIQVIETPDQIGFRLIDWAESPWRGETYLGEGLDRESALLHPKKELVLHIAEYIINDLPDVQAYFEADR